MIISKYFRIEEFVPPTIYKAWGDGSIKFIDPKVIQIADAYREFFNLPVTVNNWVFNPKGSIYKERGYRTPSSKTGASLSQHKFGRAFDCSIKGLTTRELFNAVVANYEFFKQFGLTTIEDIKYTPSWLHSDCRWTNQDELLIVKPA
jgi:hypothetical protein